MRTKLAIRVHAFLERYFPERRVFLKSDTDTRFIRLRPGTQLVAFSGMALVLSWTIVATAILLMDSIGAGNYREQARREHEMYQQRLQSLAAQRDERAAEAIAAQNRFNAALAQVSAMQSDLLASETRRRELETGLEVVQINLRTALKERDEARKALAQLRAKTEEDNPALAMAETAPVQIDAVTSVLERTAAERDRIRADAQEALRQRDALEREIRLMREQNDQIFRRLEEALVISVEPLDKMFRKAGLPVDSILRQVRRGYSGQGGPLTPISFSTRSAVEPTADELRAGRILDKLDQLNLYRIAAEKVPFAMPVKAAMRYTSAYGYRRDPKTGGRRFHKGDDLAAPMGTPVYATADGVVKFAGWQRGYGKLVIIQHAFGIETYYAHNSRLRVRKGQRVSRGDRISDMGSTGRSTGSHLHYEIRVNGKPVNPITYIKAARDVF